MNINLRKVVDLHNYLSDKDVVWFPFLFLKLRPHQELTIKHWLLMTFCFGHYFALVLILKTYLTSSELSIFPSIIKGTLIFGFWFACVTRPLWNLRARELNRCPLQAP